MQKERVNKEFQGVAPLNSKWGKKTQIQIRISHSLHQTETNADLRNDRVNLNWDHL